MKRFICIASVLSAVSVAKAQWGRTYNYKLDAPFTSTYTLEVRGVCDMCKQSIESTVKKLPGVYMADWDAGTQLLLVKYNRSNLTPSRIEQQIANTGHDTKNVKASKKAYNELPDCCKYQR